jgi:hypothetical protein
MSGIGRGISASNVVFRNIEETLGRDRSNSETLKREY